MNSEIQKSTKLNSGSSQLPGLSKPLAAEDVRCGDFVAIFSEIVELPSYLWHGDAQLLPPGELVRLRWRGSVCGTPLKVKSICLPFVLVKLPVGQHQTIDVRRYQLARLEAAYARRVWKILKAQSATVSSIFSL